MKRFFLRTGCIHNNVKFQKSISLVFSHHWTSGENVIDDIILISRFRIWI
jgi:hypothetical protein